MYNIIKMFLILLISTCYSCSIFEPASPVASYIHIDSITLSTDYPTQGSNSGRIVDAWVIYDNEYIGTFPLPADIPLIGEGTHHIQISGGIIDNGIAATRSAYTKLKSFDTTMTLTAGNNISISPVVRYGTAVQFPQLEDFDDASLSLEKTNAGTVPLVITPQSDPNAFEGNSGMVTLTDTATVMELASVSPFFLPLTVPAYLELNYKCDIDFEIGVFVTTVNGILKTRLLSVRSSGEWKKIYVSLSDLGGTTSNGIDYKIYLHAEKPTSLATAELFFDNLKVVY